MLRINILLNIVFIGIVNVSFTQLYAQVENTQPSNIQNIERDNYFEPSPSCYIELGGKLWYSINIDYRSDSSTAMSLGVQLIEDSFTPSVMYFHLYGETFRTEVGGGISGIVTKKGSLEGIAIHGVYGYRYQKKNGLIFRIGFMPFIGIPLTSTGRFIIMPWLGVSIGYSL